MFFGQISLFLDTVSDPVDFVCRPPSAFNQCLTVLEHASFACPANEQHLVGLHMQAAGNQACQPPASLHNNPDQQLDLPMEQHFPSWLVERIQQMQSASTQDDCLDSQPDWSCIQSALSVLINMTHNNTTGCNAVVAAGGLQMGIDIVSSSMLKQDRSNKAADAVMTPRRATAQDRQHVLTDVGPITAALGLLINLVENCSGSRLQLKAMQLQDNQPGSDVLQLLCRLMQVGVQPQRVDIMPA